MLLVPRFGLTCFLSKLQHSDDSVREDCSYLQRSAKSTDDTFDSTHEHVVSMLQPRDGCLIDLEALCKLDLRDIKEAA